MLKKSALFILLFNIFIALLGQGMVIPILPDYLREFDAGGAVAGYLIAAFGVAQFIFSPMGGKLSDKYGRKKLILFGLFLTVISDFLFAISYHIILLYIARFIGGVGIGVMVPAVLAYIADVTTEETRAKAMGYLGASMNLGMVLGPGAGGVIAQFGVRMPYFFASALSLIATFLTILVPESLALDKRIGLEISHEKVSITKQLAQSVKAPYFPLLMLMFIMTFGLMNYETVYSLFINEKYGFTSQDISILIMVGAIIGIIVQIGVIDKLSKRFNQYSLIKFSLLMTVIALLLMLIKINYIYLLAVSSIFFVFNALMRPILNTLLSNQAGDQQGFVSGLNTAYNSIGNIIGPIIAGNLFDININLPYVIGAMILFAAIFIVKSEKKSYKNEVVRVE